MTNDLIIPGARPSFATETETLSDWDFGSSRVPTLEVAADSIRAIIGDQIVQETEDPVHVVILGKSAEGRIFYRDTYDPAAAPKAPECYSIDGVVPAPNAMEPQSTTCRGCPMDAKGSSPTKADSKACRYRQHVALVIPGTDTIFRLRLSATGMFGEATRSGHLPFKPYGQRLVATPATPDMVITEIKRDLSLGNIRAVFSIPSWIESDEQFRAMRALTKSPEVAAAIDLTISGGVSNAAPLNISGTRPQLGYDGGNTPTQRTKMPNYTRQEPHEVDTVATYWTYEVQGAPVNTEVFCVPAQQPLPAYDMYGEVSKEVYDTYLEGVAEEAARKAAEEAARKAAAATPTPRQRTRTRIEKELQGDSLPVGNDYPRDPDGYTDAQDTYWQHNTVAANIFIVEAGKELPHPDQYKEILGLAKAQALFKEVVTAKQAAAAEHKATRRAAAESTKPAASKRRAHNAKPEDAEAPVNRGSSRTAARTSATTLSSKIGTLDD